MHDALTFPADHIPDYYLGIKIRTDGAFEEIFNGPGKIAWEGIQNRKSSKYPLHSVSNRRLQSLNALVPSDQRIPLRAMRE